MTVFWAYDCAKFKSPRLHNVAILK